MILYPWFARGSSTFGQRVIGPKHLDSTEIIESYLQRRGAYCCDKVKIGSTLI